MRKYYPEKAKKIRKLYLKLANKANPSHIEKFASEKNIYKVNFIHPNRLIIRTF